MILTHHALEHRRMQNVDPALKRILGALHGMSKAEVQDYLDRLKEGRA